MGNTYMVIEEVALGSEKVLVNKRRLLHIRDIDRLESWCEILVRIFLVCPYIKL